MHEPLKAALYDVSVFTSNAADPGGGGEGFRCVWMSLTGQTWIML